MKDIFSFFEKLTATKDPLSCSAIRISLASPGRLSPPQRSSAARAASSSGSSASARA